MVDQNINLDKVIRNPARELNQNRSISYEPEYVRLKLEPQIMEIRQTAPQVVKKNVDEERMQIIPKSFQNIEVQEELIQDAVPKQTYANVGQNKNWSDFGADEEVKPELIDYDSVKVPIKQFSEEKIESDEPRITDLQIGEYCLLIRGSVLAISENKDSLISYMEEILFGGDPKFSEITVEDLSIVKRLPIKVGVLVVEND